MWSMAGCNDEGLLYYIDNYDEAENLLNTHTLRYLNVVYKFDVFFHEDVLKSVSISLKKNLKP